MNETDKRPNIILQILSMIVGWVLISFVNLVPETMAMPLVTAIRNYDPNVQIMDKTYEPGYFREYITRDGNLMAGGYLMHNSDGAWFWFKEEMIELQPDKNQTLTLQGDLEKPPVFCDDRYYISTGYTNYIGVGKTGSTDISFIEYDWTIDPLESEDWRRDVYTLLARSETERIETTEMATLVGYTLTNDLIGWDGQTAYFFVFDEDAKAAYMGQPVNKKILLLPYTADGKQPDIEIPCESVSEIMMCGRNVAYIEKGVLKVYNLDTEETRTISADGQTVRKLNFMGLDGHHVLVWTSQDGFHTLDLDTNKQNFAEGDWVTDYWGLYVWNESIYVLRSDAATHSWKYTF